MKQVILVFFFFFSSLVCAQEQVDFKYSKEPLAKVLSEVEKVFKIKFSYDPKSIQESYLDFNKKASLQDILTAIETQTYVSVEKVSERYYILKLQKKIDLSKIQELEEVIIAEYLTSGINKRKDGSITLSPKKLGILPGLTEPDILQSLQLLPGVQSPTETASGLYIRGGTPDQNLMLWDGIKMYHSGHFFGMISAFNPYITSEVQLFTNGTDPQYGNSIASVVNIKSIDKIPLKTEGGFGFNMTHADGYLKMPLSNKVALVFSARRSYTDAINTFTFNTFSERVFQNTKISEGNRILDDDDVAATKDFFSFSDITLKAIIEPSAKDKIVVSSLFTKNKLDYGFLIEEFDETSTDRLDIKNQGLSATWNHDYNDAFSHEIQAYYSKYDLDYFGANDYSGESRNQTIKKNNIKDNGFKIHTNWRPNASNKVSLGYQLSSNGVDYTLGYANTSFPEDDFNFDVSRINNTHAIYSNYEFKKEDKWLVNIGARGNYATVLNIFYLEPRIRLEGHLSKTLRAKLSLERHHQNISQVLEFNTQDFGLENQIWALSEDDFIPLLKSNQVSSGLSFKQNGWHVDVDFYFKKTKGLTSLTSGFENSNTNFSEGESNISGLDVLIKKRMNNYRTWLSYSTMKKDFKFEEVNNNASFSGNFHIAHQLTWSHTYKWNAFDFSLGWNFRTGTPYTNALGLEDDGFTIDYDKINDGRLPNYHRLDFSATYKFNMSKNQKWKGKLGLSLLNLYGNKNILNRTYRVRLDSVDSEYYLQETEKRALSITPNIVFRVDF